MPHNVYFAPCARGLEGILAQELRDLGASGVYPARAGVAFEGALEIGYRACLWSRLASRVLLRIAEVPARSEDELYRSVRAIEWEDHLDVDATLAVDFTASRSPITHTHFGALKVKDAVVDRFRDLSGRRPDVDTERPDLLINVAARAKSAVVSVDLSGEALHRRGYREAGTQVEAPLKETLAAGVLRLAGWDGTDEQRAFVDPFCGSGTLVIEAAMMATDRAPGLVRARWGFDGWLGHDEATWHELLDEADERAERGIEGLTRPLCGFDADERAIGIAEACAARAGMGSVTRFERLAIDRISDPGSDTGLVVFNPPYGQRLGDEQSVRRLYTEVASVLQRAFAGWTAATIIADEAPSELLGIPVEASHEVRNGRIPAHVLVGTLPPSVEESMFANRLRKNAKRLRKWMRRENVSCYRVYDADMPEYAVAVDVYEGAGPDAGKRWAHVAEYAPPKTVDEAGARRRLAEVMAAVPVVLDVDSADVVLKVRRRQRGTDQYERQGVGRRRVVAEGGLLFEIDLRSYLDTGIFLDHRITRHMLREASASKRVCNLFAYTGTATVYAADGGASTTTVDLSSTYLEWAKDNMRRNGFDVGGAAHTFVRADVTSWLAEQEPASYDLVFCDPPTFSNSKRMDSAFDIQRDHVALIRDAVRLLAPGGELWFSTNRTGFELDSEELSGMSAEEFTAETIPEDFSRTPRVHRIWRITGTAS